MARNRSVCVRAGYPSSVGLRYISGQRESIRQINLSPAAAIIYTEREILKCRGMLVLKGEGGLRRRRP